MAKGLIDVITAKEFDALYTSGSVPMKDHEVPISEMKLGDWGYLKNAPDYLDWHPDGGYQGENIIKVGDDSYFGFPTGPRSLAKWTSDLITAFNTGLPLVIERIDTIPGWQSEDNKFLDVATIAMNVFDHRKAHSE